MKSLLTSYTFRALLIFVVLIALQWFPITGVLLMMFGVPILTGYMLHVLALALFFDLHTRKVPKGFLLIPVLPYLVFYGCFFAEKIQIQTLEKELQQQNPSEIITYNPEIHSLVTRSNMVKYYNIPVSYSYNHNFPEEFLSSRLATLELCKKAKGVKEFTRTSSVSSYSGKESRYHKIIPNVCRFIMPEKPNKVLLRFAIKEQKDKHKLRKTVYKFFLGDEYLNEYTNAYYASLPTFPRFFIGCYLISSTPKWECVSKIIRMNFVARSKSNLVLHNKESYALSTTVAKVSCRFLDGAKIHKMLIELNLLDGINFNELNCQEILPIYFYVDMHYR